MILFLFLLLNCSLIYGSSGPDDESGWWNTFASNFQFWREEGGGEALPEAMEDNDEEIENSVKLTELFPTLKEQVILSNEKYYRTLSKLQLQSPDPKEKEEAKEFIKKMNIQIKEKKRYTNMFWKGIKMMIDMGRLESKERRSNEEQVNILWQLVLKLFNYIKYLLGMNVDGDEDKKSNEPKQEHDDKSNHNSAPASHSSNRKAGVKDDLDLLQGAKDEFIHDDKRTKSPTTTQNEPQHFDPKTGRKQKLDRFDSSKQAEEFLRDKEQQSEVSHASRRQM